MITLYRLRYNQNPTTLAKKIIKEGTVTVFSEHVKRHEEPVTDEMRIELPTGERLTLAEFLDRFGGYTYYEVMVRFEGSDGWESICRCDTMEQANEEIEHQKTIEDDGDCEYTVMERHTNNPNGRPTKGEEPRKACTYRLQPSTAEMVRKAAEERGCSQSDLIEDIVRDALG